MNKKFTSIFAVTLVAAGLVACGRAAADMPGEHGAGTEAEARSGASVTDDPKLFAENFGPKGWWIGAATSDITLDEPLVIEGDFHDKQGTENEGELYRKVALYTQDDDHNVTGTFTLTVPEIRVKSPNTKISNSTVKGNIYVEAKGFTLENTIVDGDVIFASEEYKESADLAADNDKGMHTSEVKGEVRVEE